jgi:nucleolar protein 4
LHLRRWRVIVRNINFRANERAIEKIFRRAAGVPWEVKLPRNENGKPRGFAFVGFICREHAQKAIDNVNNTKVFL